jgi:hypothetical protein
MGSYEGYDLKGQMMAAKCHGETANKNSSAVRGRCTQMYEHQFKKKSIHEETIGITKSSVSWRQNWF